MKTISNRLKPTKLINDISFHPKQRLEIFRNLDSHEKVELLHWLSSYVKKDIIHRLNDLELRALLEHVDPDEATDLLQLVDRRRRDRILESLSIGLKDAVSTLLEFDPDTAAGLMTLDYIQVSVNDTIESVAKKFKLHEKRTGRLPVILVMEKGKLVGFLPGHELGFSSKSSKIRKFVRSVPHVSYSATHDEVIDVFRTHLHNKVAVLNENGAIVGIIYSDDVLQFMHERETSSLYDFAGVSEEESVTDSTRKKVNSRYKWLIINLGTAFLAAFTVGTFEETISKYVLLAVYMPIVAGMGGNAATQTLAVMVRGISLKQITLRSSAKTLWSELGSGFINGIINGLLVAAVVIIVNNDYKIAFILGMAMIINMLVAAFFGTLVPLVMSKLGKDPAASATVFITTATDVLGFVAFLGLATLVLA